MKTFGSSIGRTLTAVLLAAAVLAGAQAASADRASFSLYALQNSPSGELSLLRVDPATLAPRAQLSVGRDWAGRHVTEYAWSPDRRHVAVAAELRIRFFDVNAMVETGSIALGYGGVKFLQWSTPTSVIALLNRDELWRIDPRTAEVREKTRLEATVWDAKAVGSTTLLLTSARAPDGLRWRGSRLLLHRLSADGRLRTVALPGLRTAIDPWRARRGELLPPVAQKAAADARRHFANLRGIPADAVQVLAVKPGLAIGCRPWGGGTGYVVTLGAGEDFATYGVVTKAGFEHPRGICWHNPGIERPAPSDYDLLRSRPGTSQVFDMPLVVDRTGRKAFVVTSTGPIVEVDLRTMRTRSRQLPGRLGTSPGESEDRDSWFSDRPLRLGNRVVVSAGGSIRLVDTRRFSVRRLRPVGLPCSIAAARGRLFLYATSTELGRENFCDGITPLSVKGRVGPNLFDGAWVYDLQIAWPYGYAVVGSRTFAERAIVDLERGRLVARRPYDRDFVLLLPPLRGEELGD